jgi:hypothetical protein
MSRIFRAARFRLLSPDSSPSLAVVDEQKIPTLQRLQQLIPEIVDPVVHRVPADQPRRDHLLSHATLQCRLDVAEQQVLGRFVGFGQLRLEVAKTFKSVRRVVRSFMSCE